MVINIFAIYLVLFHLLQILHAFINVISGNQTEFSLQLV